NVCWSKPATHNPALVPGGIEKGRRAHLVEPPIFLLRQHKRGSGNIVSELLLVAAADDEGGDSRSPEQPCQRHLCGRHAALPADFAQGIDDGPESVFVADGRLVPAGELARRGLVAAILARKQPACQRTPHHDPKALIQRDGQQLVFGLPSLQRIVDLLGDEAQIGRASCRESVASAEGAGSWEKKTWIHGSSAAGWV